MGALGVQMQEGSIEMGITDVLTQELSAGVLKPLIMGTSGVQTQELGAGALARGKEPGAPVGDPRKGEKNKAFTITLK